MRCSECGGNVMSFKYAVHYADGHSSGYHECQKCGKRKGWRTEGKPEIVIDMKRGKND